MNNIYFDLYTETPEIPEADVHELIEIRVEEYIRQQGIIAKSNFINDFNSLGFYSQRTNIWNVFSEEYAFLGVFSNDVSGLFLGTGKQLLSIQEFLDQKSWDNINIAEWVMISDAPKPQSTKYLKAFSKDYGLMPDGQIQWNSYRGKIAFAEVRNADGSRFINGKLQK